MNLKHELTAYYIENEAEYSKEETYNVLQILAEYNDDLDNLTRTDSKLLLRLVDDSNLYNQIDAITPAASGNPFKSNNPFD